MNEVENPYTVIGAIVTIAVALIGILRRKNVWEYLKHRTDGMSKTKDRVEQLLQGQIDELKVEKENQDKEILKLREIIDTLEHKNNVLNQRLMRLRIKHGSKKTPPEV